MPFGPDAYLAKRGGFDPDAYLAKPSPAPQKKSDFGTSAKSFGISALGEGTRAAGAALGAEAGAEGGAALGALGGPAAPATVPIGTILGGLGGGIAGYYGMGHFVPKDIEAKAAKEAPTASALGKAAVDVPLGVAGLYGAGKALAPAAAKLGKAALGVPSRAVEDIAKAFEARGYKLEPGQLRADKPYESPGFAGTKVANQKLANREASVTTGKMADEKGITDKFLGERFQTLGKQYDDILDKQPVWRIDRQTNQDLRTILQNEQAAVPGQVRPVMQAASKITDYFHNPSVAAVKLPAKDLKRTLSELKKIVRTSRDGNDRYAAGQAIDAITGSITRNHPDIAPVLAKTNSQYRATIALDDLLKSGGIRGGNISLRKLGGKLDKLQGHPLYDLGLGGRELNLAGRWEGSGKPISGIESILSPSAMGRALATGTGLRSQTARSVQRSFQGD